ncbi:conserved hypothetical protein [[Clostridium] saccharolyticum WM1]|uniref:Uncharacterized protein n=1 Tax=Lacrimispora saccharolytica (strain ATCC 35040 / DSM 2544 / NRCC 2533 / WM1) TaxID=610130 RepID=D9R6E8_LACSW|nr:hypothetical protein [Lacrimispora saccharolytica]ADL05358.1 conserved hypothetical protein [[Clostridium] saccharolyticum WM1]
MKNNRQKEKQKQSTRELISIDDLTDYSIKTAYGELVYFIIHPTNISVLSESTVSARIYALMTVLKGIAEIEMLCLNSKENFDENKQYLKRRMDAEPNPVIRKLLQMDSTNLDRMQVQMATAREFLIIIRLNKGEVKEQKDKASDVFPYLSRIEKSLKDQGFTARRADNADIKRLLGVYYEQNVTTEKFEDFDGERWVILGE